MKQLASEQPAEMPMSQQKALLQEITVAITTRTEYRITEWFTEDFWLHEPGKTPLPVGHGGRPRC